MRTTWASWWLKRGVNDRTTQSELSEAPALLARVPLKGRVVTGDALYCQRSCVSRLWRQEASTFSR